MMNQIDRVYGRPYKNPNRWMVNTVYLMPEKQPVNWAKVVLIGAAMCFGSMMLAWALYMI